MPKAKPQIQIAPSILSANFLKLGDEIRALEKAAADLIHCDVMDGHFVPNLTFGPPVIEQISAATKIPLDVHLMIENPGDWVDAYAKAGANWLTVHLESTPHVHRLLQHMHTLGVKPGVSLNPATPLSALEPVIELCHHVLIMTVNPGFGGQKFIAEVLRKIKGLKNLILERKLSTLIEVDGGINSETAAAVSAAGASVLVAGTAVFKTKSYSKAIAELREIAQKNWDNKK